MLVRPSPKLIVILATVGALAACSPQQAVTSPVVAPVSATTITRALATAQQVIDEGQLVCQVGPTAFAMLVPNGAAILAKGATANAVKQVCNVVGGAAVALQTVAVNPATATAPPTISVALPSSISIPLAG